MKKMIFSFIAVLLLSITPFATNAIDEPVIGTQGKTDIAG